MAITDEIGGTFGGLFSGTFAIVIWVFVGLITVGVVWGIGYYFWFYKKKFDITAKIISRRSGEDRVYFDKAAILYDKKNKTDYLKLWNSKYELELPKFNIFYHTNKGDYVELLRESEKGFRFLTTPKVEKKYLVKHDGKIYPIADMKQYQLENDITWILQRQKTNKRLIDPESFLMGLLAHAPQIISMAVSFITLYIVLKYIPDLLQTAANIGREQTEVIGSFIIPLVTSLI